MDKHTWVVEVRLVATGNVSNVGHCEKSEV